MRYFTCQCKNTLFFENSACLQCGLNVGYNPVTSKMEVLDGSNDLYLCKNGIDYGVCNWIANSKDDPYCKSCRLNRTIPDLKLLGNLDSWRRVELAKRRMLYTLFQLNIDPPRWVDDAVRGLSFDILSPDAGAAVMTGYANGIITLNLNEADSVEREKNRNQLAEPYRTLVGHFRHETAHYMWQQLFGGKPDDDMELSVFRELFGDERNDYATALQTYYANGAPAGWESDFISAYATAHPHEDWAETWAHYLHIIDGSETACSFGFNSHSVPLPFTKFPPEVADQFLNLDVHKKEARKFMDMLHGWAKLSPALNEMAASMGQGVLYPFVFSLNVVRKLTFVHAIVLRHQQAGSMPNVESAGVAE